MGDKHKEAFEFLMERMAKRCLTFGSTREELKETSGVRGRDKGFN